MSDNQTDQGIDLGEKLAQDVAFVMSVLSHCYNPLVNAWFKTQANLGTKRGELKKACLIDTTSDSLILVIVRFLIFYLLVGYFRSGLATFYGSKFDREIDAAKHPQLFLYFSQDAGAVPDGISKIDKEKSVRWMKYTSSTITKAEMLELALLIKENFTVDGTGWTYNTGKLSVSYTDPDNGFLRGNYVLVNSKEDGILLYEKLCRCLGIAFHEDKITVANPDRNNVSQTTSTVTIAGKKYKNKRYRPIGRVRFRYAYLSFGTNIPPFFLIDLTGKNNIIQQDVTP